MAKKRKKRLSKAKITFLKGIGHFGNKFERNVRTINRKIKKAVGM